MLAISAFGAWRSVAGGTLDDVRVGVTGVECGPDSPPVRFSSSTVSLGTSREMRRVLTVEVANRSDREVRMGEVRAPYLGPGTGTVFRAETLAGEEPSGEPDDIYAVVDLDRSVAAGTASTFDIVVVLNPGGCGGPTGTFSLETFPQVRARFAGVDRDIEGDTRLEVRSRFRTPGCTSG